MNGAALLVLCVGAGVLTGILSGLLGVGGGTFTVPFLVLVAGFGQHAAEATSLLVVLPTAVAGSLLLHRRGVGDLRLGLRLGLLGSAGGAGGALLALALPGTVLRITFAVFMAIVGLRLLVDAVRDRPAARG